MRSSPFALPDRILAPPPADRRIAFLKGVRFAHRGLHGGEIVENSRAAFAAAVKAGHGVECDVQMSADGAAFVFHDEALARLTGRNGTIGALSQGEVGRMLLTGTEETIPGLDEVLTVIASQVPILIEIKAPGPQVGRLCLSVRRALEGYRGEVAVMSFNPEVGYWFAAHAPRIARGLVVSEQEKRGMRGRAERHLALWRARPDFLAYDVRDLPSRFAAAQRERGLALLTWTVRGAEAENIAAEYADSAIYERQDE